MRQEKQQKHFTNKKQKFTTMNFQKIAKTAASNLNKKVLTSDWFLGTLKIDYRFKSEIAAYLVADLAADIFSPSAVSFSTIFFPFAGFIAIV